MRPPFHFQVLPAYQSIGARQCKTAPRWDRAMESDWLCGNGSVSRLTTRL